LDWPTWWTALMRSARANCLPKRCAAIARHAPAFQSTWWGQAPAPPVALAAAERLPPDSLERIVLLAAGGVVRTYDLRRALVSARQGLDVFSSEKDRWWLGVGAAIVGTADGKRDPPAGRVGFRPPGDAALALRLHQHPWDRASPGPATPAEPHGQFKPGVL